jgi:hypothetical protein
VANVWNWTYPDLTTGLKSCHWVIESAHERSTRAAPCAADVTVTQHRGVLSLP